MLSITGVCNKSVKNIKIMYELKYKDVQKTETFK
jgi:hypothetical protein